MEHIKQISRVTCLPCSLAMVTGERLDKILDLFGHDGEEILWPDEKEPLNRRGFGHHEMIEVALTLGWAAIPIDFNPVMRPHDQARPVPVYTEAQVERRVDKYMNGNLGIIQGYVTPTKLHAVAWSGSHVYDPDGVVYSYDDMSVVEKIQIDIFYLFKRIKE